ncbi:hypothetical protein M406DRAFT_358704 [Cryphonectria parasitica EP155]|uniref:Uncharacterized protein n=1 Tax=Cryphonectria parasitica (strain ATCC 38755 / EP155) TaxID=660469 RepID=A0A9P4XSR7_CRYP1|nr:uncharacterized protein M406DRAFT_358704 [Cryphonectria parasitica EP155]KAF3760090.1 hypothetical protein M406DRAFT_358704 [Cryphonectria parasitica EP155]
MYSGRGGRVRKQPGAPESSSRQVPPPYAELHHPAPAFSRDSAPREREQLRSHPDKNEDTAGVSGQASRTFQEGVRTTDQELLEMK